MDNLKIRVSETEFETELVFVFGDRFQAVAIKKPYRKRDIVGSLHDLAENISNDKLIGEQLQPNYKFSGEINPSDLMVASYSSAKRSGFSLQPLNGVKITHLPTGIEIICENERSQHKNKAKAIELLRERLENE